MASFSGSWNEVKPDDLGWKITFGKLGLGIPIELTLHSACTGDSCLT